MKINRPVTEDEYPALLDRPSHLVRLPYRSSKVPPVPLKSWTWIAFVCVRTIGYVKVKYQLRESDLGTLCRRLCCKIVWRSSSVYGGKHSRWDETALYLIQKDMGKTWMIQMIEVVNVVQKKTTWIALMAILLKDLHLQRIQLPRVCSRLLSVWWRKRPKAQKLFKWEGQVTRPLWRRKERPRGARSHLGRV